MKMGMVLEVTSVVIDALVAETALALPRECCGLLLGQGRGADARILQAASSPNVAAEPERYFEIDPRILIDAHRGARDGGAQIIGYYHSHPTGAGQPSATDRAMAAGDGMVWGIVANGAARFWLDGPDGFEALSYVLVHG